MKLIPFESFTIETHLTKEEVKDRLRLRTGKKKAKNFERSDQNWFFGALRGDKFELQPILDNERNSWKPFLFGKMKEGRVGTSITVIMRPNLVVLIFTVIWALTAYMATDMVVRLESSDVEIGLGFLFPLISYVICTVAFHSDTDICKEHLVEITEGKMNSRPGEA